jgi:hypothetical protein
MVPWSIWAAFSLNGLGHWLIAQGWQTCQLRRVVFCTFTGLAAVYGLVFWLIGPRLDRRGVEWAFYETMSKQLPAGEPVVLLYDDWDRDPYPTPFGPIPHDVGVRLYYLNRAACWHFGADSVADHGPGKCQSTMPARPGSSLIVLGRKRDLPELETAGHVEILAQGPSIRWDRTYLVTRLWPARALTSTRDSPIQLITDVAR